MRAAVRLIASFFYLGHIPRVSGTAGSLAGLWLAWILKGYAAVGVFAAALAGFFVCRAAEEVYGRKDPKEFVLDEVCGMMLSVLWLPRQEGVYLAAFVLFRVLDIAKPWPICLLQRSRNPLSIMWDDLAAGAAANIIMQIGLRLLAA